MAKIAAKNKTFQTKIARFGEIAAFVRYLERRFGKGSLRIYSDKDKLRSQVFDHFKNSRPDSKISVFEFGVATGTGTSWILNSLKDQLDLFYGFDRFTGLPRVWRGMPIGHFSNGGEPPRINDPRVTRFTGDAELTFPANVSKIEALKAEYKNLRFFIFDMDIYEPTKAVYEALLPHLRPGDYVHFDEAFDSENELRVVDDFLSKFSVELIGITNEAALFKINGEF